MRVFITSCWTWVVTLGKRCSGTLTRNVVPAENFEELISRENELGNHHHELVECLDIHADRPARNPASSFARFSEVAQSDRIGAFAATSSEGRSEAADPSSCHRGFMSCARQPRVELADQVCIVAGRFALQLLQSIEDCFDAINGGQYEGLCFSVMAMPSRNLPISVSAA